MSPAPRSVMTGRFRRPQITTAPEAEHVPPTSARPADGAGAAARPMTRVPASFSSTSRESRARPRQAHPPHNMPRAAAATSRDPSARRDVAAHFSRFDLRVLATPLIASPRVGTYHHVLRGVVVTDSAAVSNDAERPQVELAVCWTSSRRGILASSCLRRICRDQPVGAPGSDGRQGPDLCRPRHARHSSTLLFFLTRSMRCPIRHQPWTRCMSVVRGG
jgi:hypothetical protein